MREVFVTIIVIGVLASGFLMALFLIKENIKNQPRKKRWTLIVVKDSEAWIEGFIRDYYRQKTSPYAELFLLDLGSRDDTFAIAQRCTRWFPGMAILSTSYCDLDKMNRYLEDELGKAKLFRIKGMRPGKMSISV